MGHCEHSDIYLGHTFTGNGTCYSIHQAKYLYLLVIMIWSLLNVSVRQLFCKGKITHCLLQVCQLEAVLLGKHVLHLCSLLLAVLLAQLTRYRAIDISILLCLTDKDSELTVED